jgi:lipopolysaccharide export system protein LptA
MLAIPGAEGRYAMHLGGGLVLGRCGDASMTGDSAVHLEHVAEARMIGSVRYRDTTRVLDADRVTYFGVSDRVVSEGDVRLERLGSGATLEAPRVEFLRTPFQGSRTVATGRPHMVLPTGGPGSEPFLVDSDVAEFQGEERAFARGNVEIHRSDLDATADSARFDAGGVGVLYGRPIVRGEGFELTGDSVLARFAEDELREVRSFGGAAATGQDFELQADLVTAEMRAGEVERLWAFGEGRSIGASGRFQLSGDSIEFSFTAGRLDSIASVGSAASVETEPHVPGVPMIEAARGLDPGANWLTGDTIRAFFSGAPTDSLQPLSEADPTPERLTALGSARSFYASVRDSTRSESPSRNYLLGSRIEVLFLNEEPSEVIAKDAIGIYLEPGAEGGGG